MNKNLLRPVEYSGLVRLGRRDGDGGYVVPEDLIHRTSTLLSLGLSFDWTFDLDFNRRNPKARIIGVDHTLSFWELVRRLGVSLFKVPIYTLLSKKDKFYKYQSRFPEVPHYLRLFVASGKHLRKMVAGKSGNGQITLSEILSQAPSTKEHDVFLKMDIEGCEYDVIPDIIRNEKRINCIAAEFHDLESDTQTFEDGIAMLRQHFHIVHIHGNNHGPYSTQIDFPVCVEITLVNKSLFTTPPTPSTESYPRVGLDVPNKAGHADYVLNFE